MSYAKLSDTLNANEGRAYITTNDGSNRELFEVSKISAQIDYSVTAKRMLGKRLTQHKITGAEGKGSATLYFANSEMLKRAIAYIDSGFHPNINLRIINEDSQSTIGKGEVYLNDVIFATSLVAYLEAGSEDPVSFDSDFTFDGISGASYFNLPENYR